MKKYNHLNGYDLLEKLLYISNDKGKLTIDKNTFLPISNENPLMAKAVCSMMDAYGICPKKDAYVGLDAFDDYLLCFIKESFSEKRFQKTANLLYKYIGKEDEIIRMADDSLSNRRNRYNLFKYFFHYLKVLLKVDDSFVGTREFSGEFLLSKVITEYAYGKKVEPLVNYYKTILVLLMGDYADIEWDKEILIRKYGYPGIPTRDDNTGCDLPF